MVHKMFTNNTKEIITETDLLTTVFQQTKVPLAAIPKTPSPIFMWTRITTIVRCPTIIAVWKLIGWVSTLA